ncbi:MAG TPA: SRPBCC domain-containing protein [Actinophytocola sp.]|uniref:SRPBCC family protein n=1 Tax=Actinophytocola sp. TaxID=1872138 RepID=UPI002DB5C308|nr:SRPBCC domain-containing protein [Actinophytocola sp.]HEU5474182.1 SRPBCC domain-containing protein [Actinophytocola sp.]
MPREFEVREEITIDATPEQVWAAIATGPGLDSWFMGRNQIEPRLGGRTRMETPAWTAEATVTAWEPGQHFAYRGDEAPDGTFMAFEYLIEGREGSSTVLRFVHSGLLSDDGWESEYDALRNGDRMYLEKLAVYAAHFAGRTATHNLFLLGESGTDADALWAAYRGALGLGGSVAVGDKARVEVPGLESVDGVVEFARHPYWVGVRTPDGFYSFMCGSDATPVIEYSGFDPGADGSAIERAWDDWLAKALA